MELPKRQVLSAGAALARVAPVLVAVLLVPIVLLNLVNVGGEAALKMALKGWGMVTPAVAIVAWTLFGTPDWLPAGRSSGRAPLDFRDSTAEAPPSTDASGDAVERLREQYADGDLDHAEFERRLERLLATEDVDVDDAPDALDRTPSLDHDAAE